MKIQNQWVSAVGVSVALGLAGGSVVWGEESSLDAIRRKMEQQRAQPAQAEAAPEVKAEKEPKKEKKKKKKAEEVKAVEHKAEVHPATELAQPKTEAAPKEMPAQEKSVEAKSELKQELHEQVIAPPSRPSATRETQEATPVAPSPQEEETRLTKNWGGARSKLSDVGVDLGLIYKGNVVSNFSGGAKTGTSYLGNMDFRTSLDLEKMWGWKGATAFVYFLMNHGMKEGERPSDNVGDAQGVNNVEVPTDYSAKFYEIWFQQLFHEDKISILAGIHDLNSEFYVTDTSGVFLNGSFGLGKELSQSGFNGPSIFPFTAPALRIRVEPSKAFYVQWGAFGAKAGDPENPKGTHISLKPSDGFLQIAEFAYLRGRVDPKQLSGKYGFGAWSYTKPFDPADELIAADGSAPAVGVHSGAYFLMEQTVFEDFAFFFRYGVAASNVLRFGSGLSTGIQITGLIPGRKNDRFGIGLAQAINGGEYMDLQKAQDTPTAESESTVEITYRMEVLPGIAVQPDFQYVINPDTNPDAKAASVGSLRVELNF